MVLPDYVAHSDSADAVWRVRAYRKVASVAWPLNVIACFTVLHYLWTSEPYTSLQTTIAILVTVVAAIADIALLEMRLRLSEYLELGVVVCTTGFVRRAYHKHIKQMGMHPNDDHLVIWQREVNRALKECIAKAQDQDPHVGVGEEQEA